MKFRRSGRLVDLTNYLLAHPHVLVPLTFLQNVINLQSPPLVKT